MTQINNIEIKEIHKDEESGDIYYTVEAELLEPGGAFAEKNVKEDE